MKLLPLFLVFILIPVSYASMEVVSQLENEYNLGEEISFSVKIIPDVTDNALVKLTLKCTNKEVPYYIAPIELEDGKEVVVEALPIKAFSEGLCTIRANIESLEGSSLEGVSSDEFSVSDKLEISFTVDKTDVLPGDKIKVEGSASKKGGSVGDGNVVITFGNLVDQMELKRDKFSYEFELEEDVKSGEHTLTVEVSDTHGNSDTGSSVVNVEAIPSKLDFELNKNEFKPEDILKLKVNLLDQADDAIFDDVDVKLFKKKLFTDDVVIFDKEIEANKEFEFTFDAGALPDTYILKAVFDELEKEVEVSVLEYPKIEMRVEGNIVVIKNVGNVKYNDETTIVLDKRNKTYFINKKVKLGIGDETAIDLSKEVGSGSYTVTLPEDSVGEEVVENVADEGVVGNDVDEVTKKKAPAGKEGTNVVKNVKIESEDKKGIGWITGGVIAGAGLLLSRPKFGGFLMVMIILAVIGYYNRKKIGKLIEKIRKKRENM
jgi:hypothetical protein